MSGKNPFLGMGFGSPFRTFSSAASAVILAFLEYTTANVSSFEIRTNSSLGTLNYDVDWGDGSTETGVTTTNKIHTYSTAGVYVIKITPAVGSTFYPQQYTATDYQTNLTKVDGVGGSQLASKFFRSFRGITSLTSFGNVDTSSVTFFTEAWKDCSGLTSFPLIDTSNADTFSRTWSGCSGLTSFPLIDTSNGIYFSSAWAGCFGLTSFPALDFSSATDVGQAWSGCSSLVEFPSVDFSSVTSSFRRTWYFCSDLTTFPANMFDNIGLQPSNGFEDAFRSCSLTAQSIENILTSLDANGQQNIALGISSGNNAAKSTWTAAANTAYTNLVNKGWTINYNA